jgi:hypothetical protein
VTVFIEDGAAVEELLRGPDGMVVRFLTERAALVQDAAKAQVGGHGRWPEKTTGHLANSIVKRYSLEGGSPSLLVGTDTVPYALWHHNGNGPPGDFITPKGPVLVFKAASGQVIFAKKVRTALPNRYLVDNLPLAFA